jgi:4,5-DOPA dioxygenase extradiol
VSLGAAEDSLGKADTVVDGFWYGLSKRSWQLG